jgi:uncharacterized membrane protein
MPPYARNAEWMRQLTLLSLALLLASVVVDTLLMPSGDRHANPVVWFALSLPLLILVPGAWRGRLTSFTWLGFVSMLYFAQAVVALFSPHWRSLDILQLALSITLFSGALLFVRWRARANRAAAAL